MLPATVFLHCGRGANSSNVTCAGDKHPEKGKAVDNKVVTHLCEPEVLLRETQLFTAALKKAALNEKAKHYTLDRPVLYALHSRAARRFVTGKPKEIAFAQPRE